MVQVPAHHGVFTKRGFSPLLPSVGFLLLSGMALLYQSGSPLYARVLSYWTFIPWRYPFIDLAAIPAWVRCWQQHGFDVYTAASWAACDVGPIIYSPLLLRLTFLPTDPAWTNWLGLGLVSLYLLSLGLLPIPERAWARCVMVAAAFSCLPVFAVERANLDLLIFLLVIAGALCLGGTWLVRWAGYGLLLLGGLLKFYPMVLLALILRERLRRAIVLISVSLVVVLGTGYLLIDELHRLTPIPAGAPFHNMWGARNLPSGLPVMLRALFDPALAAVSAEEDPYGPIWLPGAVASMLLGLTLVQAVLLARRADLASALRRLPQLTWHLLVAGSLLTVSCFFAAQNIGYRGVLLILLLPGLLALAADSESHALRIRIRTTVAAILFVMWELTERHVVADLFGGSFHPVDSRPGYVLWFVQELAWWWLIALLLGITMQFAANSAAWRDLQALLRLSLPHRRPPRAISG
jgi:hypothetical protein